MFWCCKITHRLCLKTDCLFFKVPKHFIAAGLCIHVHFKQDNYTATAITPFGKCYCELAAKIFNCPAFICFFKPLCKERKRGSFVNWNTLHAKRSTRCCNTWPFSIIVAGMKCCIQGSLSGSFLSPSPCGTKRIFTSSVFVWLCFFWRFLSPPHPSSGTGCNLTWFCSAGETAEITGFFTPTLNGRHVQPLTPEKLCVSFKMKKKSSKVTIGNEN